MNGAPSHDITHSGSYPDVVVTGVGMVTCAGLTVDQSWSAISHGREHLSPWQEPLPPALGSVAVAQCHDLPCPDDLRPGFWKTLSRTQQLACLAADEALLSASLPRTLDFMGNRTGCFLATTVCGMDRNEVFYTAYRINPQTADSGLLRRIQPYEAAELVRRRHHICGQVYTNLTTCVGSAIAVGAAMDAIRLGRISMALAGGAEALCRLIISGFGSLKLVAPGGCRPFDRDRNGISIGEAAAFLVLESAAHAAARGAPPLGYLRGFAATCDAFHITKPDPAGAGAARAIELALNDAHLQPRDIGYINAHGTATRDNDAMEMRVISDVWDRTNAPIPPVSSTKRLTGHTFGAAGAVESVVCLLAMRHQILPPNAGCINPDRTENDRCLPLVTAPTRSRPAAALNCNFAFGGNNTALIFSAASPDALRPAESAPTDATHPDFPRMAIAGLGVHTSEYADGLELRRAVAVSPETDNRTGPTTGENAPPWLGRDISERTLNAAEKLDAVAGLACKAIDQAWHAARLHKPSTDPGRIALLMFTAWGMIDSTVAYLDSMLDSEGRYASPLHFSRSVYSNAASAAAILLGIRGPCETLAHQTAPVTSVLCRATDLLTAGRADAVIACWADKTSPLTVDLCRRAVHDLHRHEFARYMDNPGYGAVSLVLQKAGTPPVDASELPAHRLPEICLGGPANPPDKTARAPQTVRQRPYPTDAALRLAAEIIRNASAAARPASTDFTAVDLPVGETGLGVR